MESVSRPKPVLPSEDELDEFREAVLCWFQEHGRRFPWRETTSQYETIVAELLLQRTQAESVARFFPGFLERYPSWVKLAQSSDEELASYLRPIGLWRRRAVSLRRLAAAVMAQGGSLPQTREELEALPGIGQYMANAVLLLSYEKALPLLDASMARVLERYFEPRDLVDIRYDPYLQALAIRVVSAEDPVSLNFAILDLASMLCKQSRPLCRECPLLGGCRFGQSATSETTRR